MHTLKGRSANNTAAGLSGTPSIITATGGVIDRGTPYGIGALNGDKRLFNNLGLYDAATPEWKRPLCDSRME